MMPIELAAAFVAGLLTFVAPCTLPVLPLVVGAGASGGRRRPLGVVVGFGGSFVAMSVLLASLLGAAGLAVSQLRVASAVALAVVGTALAVPLLERRLEGALAPLGRRAAPDIAIRSDGLADGLVIGAAIGLVWAPCVGPIMAAVLVAAATTGPTAATLALSGAYVAGAAVPLLVVAMLGRRAIGWAGSPGLRARMRQALGALMVVASLAVATGYDISLEGALSGTVSSPGPAAGPTAAGPVPASASADGLPNPIASDLPASAQLSDLGPAPELTGITDWINSRPLTLAGLRGKVVLVHFWTFACINCIHVQPYVKAWYARYAAAGLVVIGVHTPELSFERDIGNVRKAVADDGVTFPVAFDPSYATWNAYRNQSWPAFYLIDRAGRIRHVHGGEGDYAGMEEAIRELLLETG